MNKIAIGKRIKNIRLKNDWIISDFSKKINKGLSDGTEVSQGIISRWENGVSVPRKERLIEIAKVGDCSISYLLYGTYDEFIKAIIDNFFENHSSLEFIDKDEIIQHHISKYNIRKGKIFYELSAEHTDTNNELDISVWELKNKRDQILYDEIRININDELNKIYEVYSSNTGQQRLNRYKKMYMLLKNEFIDDNKELEIFLQAKLDEMYSDERIKYSENAHELISKNALTFYSALLKGKFQHVMYLEMPNLIDYICDELLNIFEEVSYQLNFNKYEGWNDLDDDSKEKIFNQIDEMASLLIEREVRN